MIQVIVNPIAGQGRARLLASRVMSALCSHGLEAQCAFTQCKGEATRLARAAVAQGLEAIVAVGGDGTLFEVVNGMIEQALPLYLVPCGTGNDFARALGLSKDPLAALESQLSGHAQPVDLCLINDAAFLNVSGTGFDVEVLRQTERFKQRLRGLLPYLLGVFAALRRYQPIEVDVELDGQRTRRRLTILAVANGQYIGGGMRVAPFASPTDGLFDVMMVDAVPRWKIALLLPLFVTGRFTRLSIVTCARCRSLTLSAPHMTLNLDGELQPHSQAHYQVRAGHLMMSLPGAPAALPIPTSLSAPL